jgi:mono/diheme cytochrome c family protein
MASSRSRIRRGVPIAATVLAASAALGLAACGGDREADLANGRARFIASCGSCHTLADAGTTGTVGPNLDDAFRASRRQGFEDSSFEGVVRYWISTPEQRSEPIMPANLVIGRDAEDVAAYVAAGAGTDEESPARPAEDIE